MTGNVELSELEFAALISSKICHDVIGPVGAIYNGLEVLDEDDDEEAKAYALNVIRSFTEQASAKLQFARFAFGATGATGAVIDLTTAEQISRGFVENGKHKLIWTAAPGQLPKNQVKLLLNMIASAVTALPRGGTIEVAIAGNPQAPGFEICCRGEGARPPQHLEEFIAGNQANGLDAMTIQPYYTWRLAEASGLQLVVRRSGADIILRALPIA